MSTTPQDIVDQVVGQIATYQTAAVTSLTAIQTASTVASATITTAADLMGTFDPHVTPQPTLNDVADITPPILRDVVATNIGLTDPNKNPYVPLAAGALPQYQQVVLNTGDSAQFVSDFNGIKPVLFDWLEAEIQSIISTGGQNIVAGVQDAVFNQGLERNIQILNDALDLAGARVGAKGFRYPNSMVKAAQQELIKNYQNSREDVNRKIIETMANFAMENIRAAITAGVQIDEAKVRVFVEVKNALTEIQRMLYDQYKTDLLAHMQIFDSLIKLQSIDLEVQRLDREEMRAFISAEREQLSLDNRVRISEFEAKLKMDITTAELKKFVQELKVQKNEQTIRSYAAYASQIAEAMRIDLSEVQERNKLRLEAAKTITASTLGASEEIAKAYVGLIQALDVSAISVVKA